MATLTDPELMKACIDEVREIFQNYSIDVSFKDTPSYWEGEGLAVIATIKPCYDDVEFHMRMELLNQMPSGREAHIEFGEDNWEPINEEIIWRWLFFQSLEQQRRNGRGA